MLDLDPFWFKVINFCYYLFSK